jgi:hypothetical protein
LPQGGETVRTAYNVWALLVEIIVIWILLRVLGWA